MSLTADPRCLSATTSSPGGQAIRLILPGIKGVCTASALILSPCTSAMALAIIEETSTISDLSTTGYPSAGNIKRLSAHINQCGCFSPINLILKIVE